MFTMTIMNGRAPQGLPIPVQKYMLLCKIHRKGTYKKLTIYQ